MATIRLWLRNDKIDKNGFAPIHLIYQVRGQRKYHNTKIKLRSANWDAGTQAAIYLDKKTAKQKLPTVDFDLLPTSKEIENINADLIALKKEFGDQETDFQRKKVAYSADMVVEALKKQKQPETKKDIKTSVVDFIEQYAKDAAITKKAGSLSVYNTNAKHLKGFEILSKTKVTFETIDITTLKQFQKYLIEEKGMNNTTVAKQLSTLKTLLNFARTEYKIKVNQDYRDFKISRKDADHEVLVLTNDELQSIIHLDLSDNKRLDKVRDIFVFACTTGLRFSDLEDLKREHIRGGAIKKTAVKTGQKLDIPLTEISDGILSKYGELNQPLPMISSQKLNDYVKEVGEMAGINTPIEKVRDFGTRSKAEIFRKFELMSIHMGRRTFATLSLEKGMASQDVMAITGHTTYASFKRYVNVSSERKQAVMAKAWGAVPSKLKVAK